MTVVPGCTSANPVGAAIPAEPLAAAAPSLAPNQGDHVFGDVVGVIQNSLNEVFGGGQNSSVRMKNFNGNLATIWQGIMDLDFGHHGNDAPVVTRAGNPEPDEHAHIFGGYSNRLRWHICEIVCLSFSAGVEKRVIGGATRSWRNKTLSAYDDLIARLVDETALHFYIKSPGQTRNAGANVRHTPISLSAAREYTDGHAGPGHDAVLKILMRYVNLRNTLDGLLQRFEGANKTLNANNDTWT